jgi:carboxymethylenebutenolidase
VAPFYMPVGVTDSPGMEKKQFNPLKMTDGSVIDVWATWPDEKERYPAILLLDEGFGVNAHIRSVAERLSREGYVVFVPDLYHRLGKQLQLSYGDTASLLACVESIRPEELVADLKATLSAMDSQFFVDRSKIGTLGFCYGGGYSMVANSIFPLSAGVSFYGIGLGKFPYSSLGSGSPHLLFWGAQDINNPPDLIAHFQQNLAERGRDFTSVTISYAGGGFFCEERSSYNPLAARQAWGHTISFFDYLLK